MRKITNKKINRSGLGKIQAGNATRVGCTTENPQHKQVCSNPLQKGNG